MSPGPEKNPGGCSLGCLVSDHTQTHAGDIMRDGSSIGRAESDFWGGGGVGCWGE